MIAIHETYMRRCLDLARRGEGSVSPNPLVGCVIVHEGRIIGEGFHREFGGPHAEVNAVESVRNRDLLAGSILYVSLEPCAHFGKTPPCADMIIANRIPKVVIGMEDPFPAVAGKGTEKLREAGITVETGILEGESRELNRRFVTFHEKKRPFVILKWAQTLDGFIAGENLLSRPDHPLRISGDLAIRLAHLQRSTEDAVLVGTRTAFLDNPELTVREWSGRNPVRIVLDRSLRLPGSLKLFNHQSATLVFNGQTSGQADNLLYEKIDFDGNLPEQILDRMYMRNLQSLVVEGGSRTLQSFIDRDLWDEAHIYTGSFFIFRGLKAPSLSGTVQAS